MKVKFSHKDGSLKYVEVDYKTLKNKVISLYGEPSKIYTLQGFLNDPMSFSVERKNYQRVSHSDGSFEYLEV
jgi:hypothetical protein